MAKLLCGLMLAHLTEEDYHPLSKTLAVIAGLSLHALFSAISHTAQFGHMEPEKLQVCVCVCATRHPLSRLACELIAHAPYRPQSSW